MKKFSILLKQEILNSISTSVNNNSKRKRSTKIETRLFLIYGLFALLSIFYQYSYSTYYKDANLISEYPKLIVAISTFLVVYSSLYYVKNEIFGAKNFEFLESLPISNKLIIAVKGTAIYLEELIYVLIFMIPCIVWSLIGGLDPLLGLYYLFISFFIPIIPIVIGGLISFIFTYIFERIRIGKFIQIILSMLFILAIIYISFATGASSDDTNQMITSLLSITNGISNIFIYLKLVNPDKIIYLLYFVLVNLFFFGAFVLILGLGYKKINNIMLNCKRHVNYVKKEYKLNKKSKSFISNEIKRECKSVPFVLNTFIGYFMYLIGIGVLIYFYQTTNDDTIRNIILTFGSVSIIGLTCFSFGAAVPSAINITLEANNLWIIQTSPIETRDILKYKRLSSLFLQAPFLLIGLIAASIGLGLDFIQIISMIVTSILFVYQITLWGQWFNLKHPKLDWTNETQAIKNSTAVLLNMLIMFLEMAILCTTIIIINMFTYTWISLIVGVLLVVLFGIYPFIQIRTKGCKLFEEL